ncbi:MAG: uroporphyrinogen decarboxylase family protein [Kiritimatiellae bacterium]|nr:uroporphyrinogen decarboxylase family protein [Kiritimatiellia bacterium]
MTRKLSPRENLLRTLRRQGYEWAPLDQGGFCESQVQAFRKRFGHDDYPEWFGSPVRHVGVPMTATCTDPRQLYRREKLPADIDFDVWGVGHSREPDCWHMTRMHHPLRGEDVSLEEIRAYPMPALSADALSKTTAQTRSIHDRGLAVMGGMACTVWEISWYLRSMEDLMADMMTDDPRATAHLDRVTANSIERIRVYARAGVDLVQLGDDIGMQSTPMMSLELWRRWLKPRLAAIIAAGRAIKPDLLIFYHSCGYVLPFLDELIEVGVDVLNPVQPECMEFAEVHRRTAGRLSYWGTLGTQRTLPFGTPAEVREVIWNNLRLCGPAGGLVVSPTHLVEPEVPWENLVAMKEAVESYRPK